MYTSLVKLHLLPPLPPRRRPQTVDSFIEEGGVESTDHSAMMEAPPPPPPPQAPTAETIFESHVQVDKSRRKELAEKALAERLAAKKANK